MRTRIHLSDIGILLPPPQLLPPSVLHQILDRVKGTIAKISKQETETRDFVRRTIHVQWVFLPSQRHVKEMNSHVRGNLTTPSLRSSTTTSEAWIGFQRTSLCGQQKALDDRCTLLVQLALHFINNFAEKSPSAKSDYQTQNCTESMSMVVGYIIARTSSYHSKHFQVSAVWS